MPWNMANYFFTFYHSHAISFTWVVIHTSFSPITSVHVPWYTWNPWIQPFISNSSVISAFSEAMLPATIHTLTHACLTVVWQCPYILGLGWARHPRLDLTASQPWTFSNKLDLILHPWRFFTMNNLHCTVWRSSTYAYNGKVPFSSLLDDPFSSLTIY